MKRAREDGGGGGGEGGCLLLALPLDVWYHYARVVPSDALVELARTPLCKRWVNMWMSERALPMWHARWSRTIMSRLPSFTITHPLLGLRSLLDYAYKWVLLDAYIVRFPPPGSLVRAVSPMTLPMLVHFTFKHAVCDVSITSGMFTVFVTDTNNASIKTHASCASLEEGGHIWTPANRRLRSASEIFCFLLE